MVVSMTGYGRGKAEDGDTKVTVEMKTVNHRFCEFIDPYAAPAYDSRRKG